MITITKRMFSESKSYWDLKSMVKVNSLATFSLIIIAIAFYMKDGIEVAIFPIFLLTMIWVMPFLILPLFWFFYIKPIVDNHHENINLQKKYNSMLKRFNKTY